MADLHMTMLQVRTRLDLKCHRAGQYTGKCPCHDDRVASLSVTLKRDRILIHCFAGCPAEAIVDWLRLDWEDLYEDPIKGRSHRNRGERPACTPPTRQNLDDGPPPDFGLLLEACRAKPGHFSRLLDLADELGAAPESRRAYAQAAAELGVVWVPRHRDTSPHLPHKGRGWRECWAFPERDADGRVIGITRRFPGGSKKAWPGGKRGLIYADSALEDATILCPEGGSDVIVLAACGLSAVGRPSNVGGIDLLAKLLNGLPGGETVVVIGENDLKPDGGWPGRDGMEKTAGRLADALTEATVLKAMTPPPAKDARVWLAGRSGEEAGSQFLAALFAGSERCPPESTKQQMKREVAGDISILGGLRPPPPAAFCRRGGASLLRHCGNKAAGVPADPRRHRVVRHACDCWHCFVCRTRLAFMWADHVAKVARRANSSGRTLYALDTTDDILSKSLRRLLLRKQADWAALETWAGLRFVLVSLPADAGPPPGATPIALEELGGELVKWAGEVRTWPEALSRKRTHPVRTSKSWGLPEETQPKFWEMAAKVDAIDPEPVLDAIASVGLSAAPVDWSDASFCWGYEYLAPTPDLAQRATRALEEIDARPALPARPPNPDNQTPWDDDPGGGSSG